MEVFYWFLMKIIKNEVFDYLNNYDLSDLQNREIPENCSQNLQVLDQVLSMN